LNSQLIFVCKRFLVALLLTALFGSAAFARPQFAALAVDARTGAILFSDDADGLRHPASLTKMMTLYVLFQELKSGRITRETNFNMSDRCAGMAPSKMNIKAGGSYTVEEAIKSVVVKSANDVACSIAENLGGSESAYAQRMTRTARDLGMKNTTFVNASGLPNPAQLTTARDMATLGLRLQRDYPQYYPYFRTTSFMFRGKLVRGHNRVTERYPGTDGIKTGYIANAGFNLVTSTRHGDKRLVGVVLGSTSTPARDAYMIRMLESNFSKAKDGVTIAALPGTSAGAVNPIMVAQAAAPQAPVPASTKVNTKALALFAQQASNDTPPEAAPSQPVAQDDMAALVTSTAKAPVAADAQDSKKPKVVPFAVVSANDQPNTLANAQSADSWTIQVGIFANKDGADEKLAVLRGKMPELLANKQSFTQETQLKGKQVYRARFAGFDAKTAKMLCSRLSRQGTKCQALGPST